MKLTKRIYKFNLRKHLNNCFGWTFLYLGIGGGIVLSICVSSIASNEGTCFFAGPSSRDDGRFKSGCVDVPADPRRSSWVNTVLFLVMVSDSGGLVSCFNNSEVFIGSLLLSFNIPPSVIVSSGFDLEHITSDLSVSLGHRWTRRRIYLIMFCW